MKLTDLAIKENSENKELVDLLEEYKNISKIQQC